VWTILKDNIGKDLSRVTMPLYFNDPTGMCQRPACVGEYCYMIEIASSKKEPEARMAYVVAYASTLLNTLETMINKPFNPLLGETYELIGENFRYFAE